jgi:hypothetical protein
MTIHKRVLARRGIRKKVVAALGGRCVWCQATDKPMEIDHIEGGQGQGNAHRKAIRMPLEEWLYQEYQRTGYWSSLVQLLCVDCHGRKSGRIRMPPRKGNMQLNVSLPADLVSEVMVRAAVFEGGKSAYVEHAIRAQMSDGVVHTVTDGIHQHISTASADIKSTLDGYVQESQSMRKALQEMQLALQSMAAHLQSYMEQQDRRYDALLGAFDRVRNTSDKASGFSLFRGIKKG